MKSLCLDFGNTRQKCAIFQNDVLVETFVFSDKVLEELQQLIQIHHPQFSILSSVILHDKEIENLLSENSQFHLLNFQSNLPITTPVGKPETIGADRLALCSAAADLFNEHHKLVIGLGSCITFNFINKFNEFLGGSISPGMYMRFKAMNDYTALLPIIQPEHQFPLVGYDTKTNLLSGVLFGLSKEIDGIVDLYKEKYNNIKVVLTGGDAEFFSQHLKNEILYEPDLLFKGLLAISKRNRH
ncbi:MAG: type III pantothenate kinase [Chitinophagaceae bacterium]|nr:type III pantothenate kinase [Chitinophagaceae bacterium]